MVHKLGVTQVATGVLAYRDNFPQRLWSTSAAIGLSALALLLPACTTNDPNAGGPTAQSNVSTEEVAEETNELLGQSVTVRSEVEEKVGAHSFTIGDDKLFGDEKILVINATGAPTVLPEDTELQVTGEVQKLVVADVEREFNLNLEPELEVEYKDRPVIIAQSIALAPEPGEVTENPSAFYGKVLAVKGEVEDITSPTAFRLDEEGLDGVIDNSDLLVLVSGAAPNVEENKMVVVTGELRPFVVADIERDYDLTWDLDLQRTLEAEYREKPVLVAKYVFPAAED